MDYFKVKEYLTKQGYGPRECDYVERIVKTINNCMRHHPHEMDYRLPPLSRAGITLLWYDDNDKLMIKMDVKKQDFIVATQAFYGVDPKKNRSQVRHNKIAGVYASIRQDISATTSLMEQLHSDIVKYEQFKKEVRRMAR